MLVIRRRVCLVPSEWYVGELGMRCLSTLNRGQDSAQQSPISPLVTCCKRSYFSELLYRENGHVCYGLYANSPSQNGTVPRAMTLRTVILVAEEAGPFKCYRFQKCGVRIPITVKTSRRPASIRKHNSPLENAPAPATLLAYSPIPGPELLTAEQAILMLETKPLLSSIRSMDPTKIKLT